MGRVIFEQLDVKKLCEQIRKFRFDFSTGWDAPFNLTHEYPERLYLWVPAKDGWNLRVVSQDNGHFKAGCLSFSYNHRYIKKWTLFIYMVSYRDHMIKLAEYLASTFDVEIEIKVKPEAPEYQEGQIRLFGYAL